jgi:hypothetical protein
MSVISFSTPIPEQTSAVYRFALVDEDDITVDAAAIGTLLLTSYDLETGAIINGRLDQDVLNTNDVNLTTEGGVTTIEWVLQPADTIVFNQLCGVELHIAQFRWSWDAGRRFGARTIRYLVENLSFVPASP